ncbi:metalloproteinase inhibitor 4 [Pantherophis guttatus]|uniref:Metalloproteinase inhibitor 4 n=1 Tax=Pantherophis guttatus TaxID=94885 RepID=A0A6P9DP33_PANGU|nr:metalloproteinase inhibitor 4 [Pantherophis guttatus]
MIPLLNPLLFPPLLLLTLSIQDPTEACSCFPTHPQQQICSSNIVIRANIKSEKVVEDSSSSLKMIRYEIKQIKIFKGFEKMKDVQYVFTELTSAKCGIKLNISDKKNSQYLLSGEISHDGRVFIYLCNFIKPWNKLTRSQKINLRKKYEMGCDCKITACIEKGCYSTVASQECLWTDWLLESTVYGYQANNSACLKYRDGVCKWHNNLP